MHLDIAELEVNRQVYTLPQGSLWTQHGNMASRFTISEVAWHTIDEFKEKIVPTLYSSPEAEGPLSYYVIRDLSHNKLFTVEPDGVTEMTVTRVEDFRASEIIESIQKACATSASSDIKFSTRLNASLPVMYYDEIYDGGWRFAVKVPETRILLQHNVEALNNIPVYMPPSIYVLHMTSSNIYRCSYIAWLLQDSIDWERIRVVYPTLPNVAPGSGRICIGNVRIDTGSESRTYTKSEMVTASLDMFLNSSWNLDYMSSHCLPDNLDVVVKELLDEQGKKREQFKELHQVLGPTAMALGKLIFVLRHPGAWERLNWQGDGYADFESTFTGRR